ncbi:putative sugar transporter [Candidatus Paraburkholderia calva]|nr:putative sugar transporter [Candidatus Paraburkholderia calva]
MLTPIFHAFGWRSMFFLMDGIGLVVIVPLYMAKLGPESEAPYRTVPVAGPAGRLTLESLGGYVFLLLLLSYVTQGMLFWGVTLWIPLAVQSVGFTGMSQAFASSLPYIAAVLLAVPMSRLFDRTGKRVLIAALALLIPGMPMLLPMVQNGDGKLALISVALGYYASSYAEHLVDPAIDRTASHRPGIGHHQRHRHGRRHYRGLSGRLAVSLDGLVYVGLRRAGRIGHRRQNRAAAVRAHSENARAARRRNRL